METLFFTLKAGLVAFLLISAPALAQAQNLPKVYMTRDISPSGLEKTYEALGRRPAGKVAVKLTFGEPGGRHYLAPDLIKALVKSVNGTFIEGNTAYGGKRGTTEEHLKVARDHGFAALAPVDVLDAEGEINLPIKGGSHLKEVPVGSHFRNYDSILVLSHFKGHAMGGFGGALKNISIGIASPAGKRWIHTAGNSKTNAWNGPKKQEDFIESMAEAAAGMIQDRGPENMLYISVLNNLSIDCDCSSNPARPEIHDIGILASLDPVALDKASVDLIYQADDRESASLKARIEAQKGLLILTHAEKLGLGNQKYELIDLD